VSLSVAATEESILSYQILDRVALNTRSYCPFPIESITGTSIKRDILCSIFPARILGETIDYSAHADREIVNPGDSSQNLTRPSPPVWARNGTLNNHCPQRGAFPIAPNVQLDTAARSGSDARFLLDPVTTPPIGECGRPFNGCTAKKRPHFETSHCRSGDAREAFPVRSDQRSGQE
jgi:hypothetical protein